MTLDAVEFLRRFLQHVLPKGFLKIRHYGLLANRHRDTKLQRSRQRLMALNLATALACAELTLAKNSTRIDTVRIDLAASLHCPHCGSQRFLRISVRLIVPNEEEAKEIEESEVKVMRLRSSILELLTAQTSDHIVSADGKVALKKEIAERATHIVEPVEVSDVLFSDFVVQY